MTVFMALTVTLIFSVILASVESARVNTVKMLAQTAGELAVESTLAEYNIPLYERYGILAVDGNREDLAADILSYAKKNEAKGYYEFRVSKVHLCETVALADKAYQPLEKEIVQYMKGSFKDALAGALSQPVDADLLSQLQKDKRAIGHDISEKAAQAKADTDRLENESSKEDVIINSAPEKTVKDPRKSLTNILKDGLLSCVLPKGMIVSECTLEKVSSHGKANVKCPEIKNFEDASEVTKYLDSLNLSPKSTAVEGMTDLIVNAYILKHFKQAAKKDKVYACDNFDSRLQYEAEYVICGHDSDRDNLLDTINRLVLIRTAFNMVYLFTDAVKKAEAHAAAAALTTLLPFLEPLVYVLIMAAWGYAEGVIDVRGLMAGGRIPLFKNSANWQLSLSSLADGKLEGSVYDHGLMYEDYLKILLTLTARDMKYERMENLMQANIRLLEGYESFDIRRCYYGMTCLFEYTVPARFSLPSEGSGDYIINEQWSECY